MNSLDQVHLNFNSDNLWVLNLCLALLMFGVALDLKVADFKRLIDSPKASIVGLSAQFVVLPFLTFLMVWIIQPQPSIALGMILVAACPGGNISNSITHLAKGNTALAVSITAVGTLFAIFLTPLNFQLYGNLYQPAAEILRTVRVDPWDMIRTVVVVAGIPIVIGMMLSHYYPAVSLKLSRIMKPLSIVIFAGFVVIALANNFAYFLRYIHYVLLLVFVQNAIAMFTGFMMARAAGLSFVDQKTLAIETGIHNSGLGLVLIFAFFDGLGGMAFVAAWWGIWHILSGLCLATYWSKSAVPAEIPSLSFPGEVLSETCANLGVVLEEYIHCVETTVKEHRLEQRKHLWNFAYIHRQMYRLGVLTSFSLGEEYYRLTGTPVSSSSRVWRV
ncbi:MAG: symporter [Azospira oryzae]|nr:MAG: symporter [Azospira oryzae]